MDYTRYNIKHITLDSSDSTQEEGYRGVMIDYGELVLKVITDDEKEHKVRIRLDLMDFQDEVVDIINAGSKYCSCCCNKGE